MCFCFYCKSLQCEREISIFGLAKSEKLTSMTKQETIIFDLDGTALDSPQSQLPSQRVIDAIHLAKDSHYLCAATGRVWSFAKPVLRSLNLTDPCVVSAGTQMCDPQTGDVLWQQNIETVALGQVAEVIKQNLNYKVLYNDYNEDTYFRGDTMALQSALHPPPIGHDCGRGFGPTPAARHRAPGLNSPRS